MRRVLLILCVTLPVLAQPLPLAWPDRPQGSVLFSTPTTAFGGASLELDENHWLLAWCDMRDGQGRLLLQKFSLDDPSAGGPWSTQVGGLGTVEALAHTPSTITPFMPVLAPDGAGGAYVLWQEMLTPSYGELRLQRVGADGGFLWPEDRIVAPQVPVPEDDCLDLSERCRSWEDSYRRLLADETGAWVVWRTPENVLRVQRLDTGGVPDPDFPADGMPLDLPSYSFQLLDDGQGSLLVAYQDERPPYTRGMLLGLRQDGQPLFPGGAQRLTPLDTAASSFRCVTAGENRYLGAWKLDDGLRLQLYDQDLRPLWDAAGLVIAPYVDDFMLTGIQVAGPPYGLAYRSTQGWQAQLLDEAGQALWSSPPWLDLLPGEGQGRLLSVSEDEQGLIYAYSEEETLFIQRLSPEGTPLWNAATAQLGQPGQSGAPWRLSSSPAGELRMGWLDGLNHCQRICRRDGQGQDLLSLDQSKALQVGGIGGSYPGFLFTGARPLVKWLGNSEIYLQAVDGHSGQLGWGFLERPVATHTDWQAPRYQRTADGCWLLTSRWNEIPPVQLLELQRLDEEANVQLPLTLVMPAVLEAEGYVETFTSFLANGDNCIYVGVEQWAGRGLELRLQRLGSDGNLFWGPGGLLANPAGAANVNLLGLAPAPAGLFVLWHRSGLENPMLFLQRFDESGTPQYLENEGWGRPLDLLASPWGSGIRLVGLPDGGLLVVSNYYTEAEQQLHIRRLDSEGEENWRRAWAPCSSDLLLAEQDAQGRLWLGQVMYGGAERILRLERLAADGEVESLWRIPLAGNEYLDALTLLHGNAENALVTVGKVSWSGEGMRVKGWRLDESAEQPVALFNDLLTPAHLFAWQPELAPGPEGDAWLIWRDDRGGQMGYGSQARILRLDVLDANTGVDPSTRPSALRLAQNQPNPFNPETIIRFELAQAGPVRLEVFNLAGQRVRVLQDGPLTAGAHALRFDARDGQGRELGSGLYIYRVSTPAAQESRRMLLLR